MSDVEKINCARISFAPLSVEDIESPVNEVLRLIESSGLKVETGAMDTLVWGSPGEISDIIEKIQSEMDGKAKYILDIRISNTCGCAGDGRSCRL
ncbi:MAG: thiamine-binding protein [Peptostreptococcaceae bacterium]|nr:thiamine-binding protein [Peptostreptococcaceae bacterium]